MPKTGQPVLILGQGLAGSCLALECLNLGLPFRVVDVPWLSQSSKVAAGILNPLIFRYYTLSWRAEQYLDYSKNFYKQVEKLTGQVFLHETPLLRIFGEQEALLWKKKASVHPFSEFMQPDVVASYPQLELRHGAGVVGRAAWIDTGLFVSSVRELLKQQQLLEEREWDYHEISTEAGQVHFDGNRYSALVFCEGYRAVQNPWLTGIPFRPVKGDVITLRIPEFESAFILNKNFFLVPLGDQLFRLGSTYIWDFEDESPVPHSREKLLSDLKAIVSVSPEVVEHKAGIRPAMADRRPVVGKLPTQDKMFVFNGLGSRGGLLAPPLANYLARLLVNQAPTDAEVGPERFFPQ